MQKTEEFISHGISLIENHDDFRTYRVNCNCHDNEHDITIFVSKDFRIKNQIELEFQVTSDSWKSWSKFLKALWLLLTRGKINMYSSIILDDKTTENLIRVLEKEMNKNG